MNNKEIFNESKKYMPGGVNSPVRAYRGLDISPPIIKSGNGVIIKDEEDKEYIDFVLGFGPLLLGHCDKKVVEKISEEAKKALTFGAPTKLELEMAEFLCNEIPNFEMVRMVNSGTEATMSAVKLARGYTKRDKIIKFAGSYHGHFDGFLVEAGSGVLTEGILGTPGVPKEIIKNTLVAIYNDLNSVEELFLKYKGEIAAVILEPVAGNMGVIKADKEFLHGIRKLCDENNSLLIFDEVMCGFRIAYKGAQEIFNVAPDLIAYAKIIGGGLPCGAYGGLRKIMENLSPMGEIYQAGTMSGNPIVMASGIQTLRDIRDNKNNYYEYILKIGAMLEKGIYEVSEKYNIPITINRVGGMFTIFFTNNLVNSYEDVKKCNIKRFNRYFTSMIKKGINIPPSQYEAVFLSTKHTKEHIKKFVNSFEEFMQEESKY